MLKKYIYSYLAALGLCDVRDLLLHFEGLVALRHVGWLSKQRICLECRRHRRHGFDPWVGKIPWRRKWQSTLVFLPGKSYGERSLVGYSPWGHKESDMTEQLSTDMHAMWELSSLTRDRTCIPCIGRQTLNHWTTREGPLTYFYAAYFPNLLYCGHPVGQSM